MKEDADERVRVKWSWLNVTFVIIKVAVFIMVALILKDGFGGFVDSKQIIEIMESKYHEKFVFEKWHTGFLSPADRMAVVHSEQDPDKEIYVSIYKGSFPWDYSIVDHYPIVIMEEYSTRKVESIVKSAYAKQIYLKTETRAYINPEKMNYISKHYTLEDLRKGPSSAPKAYEHIAIYIYMFGDKKDFEAMIQEQYVYYKEIDKAFEGTDYTIVMAVCVEKALERPSEFLRMIEDYDDYIIGASCLIRYVEIGDAWHFDNCDNNFPQNKTLNEYSFFREYMWNYNDRVLGRKKWEE